MLTTATIELSCETYDFTTGAVCDLPAMNEGLREAARFHKQQQPSHDIKLILVMDFDGTQELYLRNG